MIIVGQNKVRVPLGKMEYGYACSVSADGNGVYAHEKFLDCQSYRQLGSYASNKRAGEVYDEIRQAYMKEREAFFMPES